MIPKLTKGYSSWGADMGRQDTISETSRKLKFHLVRLWLKDGYDSEGAYWGIGKPLYRACAEGSYEFQEMFVRAYTRTKAKELVLAEFPLAVFYR